MRVMSSASSCMPQISPHLGPTAWDCGHAAIGVWIVPLLGMVQPCTDLESMLSN